VSACGDVERAGDVPPFGAEIGMRAVVTRESEQAMPGVTGA
jgi:hypothetical protein